MPVTYYEEYDMEENHPDFYSNKLKTYTDKLVYIPYFVLSEPDPNNKAFIEGMAHFCPNTRSV